ncbi:hypothetical protein [Cupriavidus basilensis]|uniref:Uncharacterized protein n=1 Tax=Cupriavidus basilensis TaxID=68895 RepID=A0A643FSW5_9BURK|nr:hypothetical protein [Cupriavidus basilensis]QOT82309.1 hypothetical protein F7R26_039605 [Cupriavidus basilensis]
MTRKFAPVEALAAGEYVARTKDTDMLRVVMNGHQPVHPEARCISDGKWCTFYRDGAEVWSCNALYAAAHFLTEPITESQS